ncbi:MAG: ABC transporter permease subunit, partial [Fimbriimonas ginsengisoli]|nr:ABC transporter permease subunit [Fimbriimonas ginsengisoli]
MASPIADLSYRSYDGPLLPPTMRWWVVAKSVMRLAIRKKGFWVWANLSYYWFIILAAVFYFVDVLAPTLPGGANPFFSRIVWKDQFLDAFSIAQMFLFIIALLIGAGAIANDNRSNALLVYLSKPCSKLDYLFGKWMAIFLILVAITGVPTLLFFVYGLLSYRHYGFISQDPALFWRL